MNFPGNLCFHSYRPAAWLRISGPDAGSFLQGQFSNDILSVKAEEAIYGLWLDHKGKIIADSFILGGADGEYWIGSVFSTGDAIRGLLEEHLVADDVTIEDMTGNWRGIAILGEGAEAWLRSSPRAGRIFRGRRGAAENWEWVFPAVTADAAAAVAGGREESAEAMERRRIAAGIPRVPADLGPADLPQEGGLDAAAVSYSKGCYVGQEVMARLKSSGRVRRRLARVTGRGAVPSLPSPLFQDGRRVGELRSAVADGPGRFIGLALLTLLNLRPDAPLSPSADAEPTIAISD